MRTVKITLRSGRTVTLQTTLSSKQVLALYANATRDVVFNGEGVVIEKRQIAALEVT